MEHLRTIAEHLQVSLHWLHTGAGTPWVESDVNPSSNSKLQSAVDIGGTHVIGIAEGEVWREGKCLYDAFLAQASADIVPVALHPDFAGLVQFAIEVRGTIANRTVNSGEYVICKPYAEARVGGRQEGDLVVVEKTRTNGNESERKIVVGRMRFGRTGWEIVFESDDSRYHIPIRLSSDLKQDVANRNTIDIFGLVLGIFRDVPSPKGQRERWTPSPQS
jgi:hypothetical protein